MTSPTILVANQNGWWSVTCPELSIGGSGVSKQAAIKAFLRSWQSLEDLVEANYSDEVEEPPSSKETTSLDELFSQTVRQVKGAGQSVPA